MTDIRKLLEKMDSMARAEKKPAGPKFPGYWKGTDPASKAKNRMVGSSQESVIKDLGKTAKEKTLEWRLQESLKKFKEDDSTLKVYNTKDGGATFTEPNKPSTTNPATTVAKPEPIKPQASAAPSYTGIDPIVRQRQGMQPATQDEIRTYLDKNPPVVQTANGPLRTSTGQAVQSGGATAVGRAADAASPDRERAEAMPPGKNVTPIATQPAQTQTPPALSPREPVVLPNKPAETSPDLNRLTKATTSNVSTVPNKPTQPIRPTAAVPTMPAKVQPGSWQDVWKNNPELKNPNLIRPGQQIKLPDGSIAVVDKGDTLSGIAKRYRQGAYREGTPVQEQKKKFKVNRSGSLRQPVESFEQKFTRLMQEQATTQSDLGIADQGLSRLFGNLEKRDDGNWYHPGGVKVTDPVMISKAEKSSTPTPASVAQPTSKSQEYGWTDAAKDVVQGKKLPSQAFEPIIYTPDNQTLGAPQKYKPSDSDENIDYVGKINDLDKQSKQLKQQISTLGNQMRQDIKTLPAIKGQAAKDIERLNRNPNTRDTYDKELKIGKRGNTWYYNDNRPVTDPATIAKAEKNNPLHFKESNNNKKIGDRYDPDEFDAMVTRLGQRAKQGPMKTVYDEKTRRYKVVPVNPAKKKTEDTGSATDPNQQATAPSQQSTSAGSTGMDPKAQQAMKDQQIDIATAKGTVSGLKNLLGPQVDTNAAATGIAKANDNKPLNKQEQQSIAGLTPLMMKAAETPAVAQQLKTALSTAGMLSKLGK